MTTYKEQMESYISGDIMIVNKKLSSISGGPNHISGDFYVWCNDITSLMGGPQLVDGGYNCADNLLTDLTGAPSIISYFDFTKNNITSLVGIHKIIKSCKVITFAPNEITQGGIGLLLISDLTSINSGHHEPFEIIKNYLGSGTKGMMMCRTELISSGFANYAKL